MSYEFKTNFDKAIKKAQNTLERKSVYYARRIGEEVVQKVASFDEVDIVPVYTKSKVTLSLSGDAVDKQLEEDTLLSQLIAEQEQATIDKLQVSTEIILKEAFKG